MNQEIIDEFGNFKEFIYKDNVNDSLDEDNWTALHCACAWNRLDLVKYLLSIGANWNIKDVFNKTPLDIAIRDGHTELKYFLQLYIRFNK